MVQHMTSENDQFMIIRTPLDMEGTILVFLRNMFKIEVIPDLKWHPVKEKSQIAIEVADKINQEKYNAYPAIFVSIGDLSFQTVGLGDGFFQVMNDNALKKSDDRARVGTETGRQTVTLQQFPAKVTVYSNKTEAYIVAYKITKLMISFHSALKNHSNLYSIDNLRLGTPRHRPDISTEIYSVDVTFSCQFFDQDLILDVSRYLRQAHIMVQTAKSNGTDVTSMELWLDNTEDLDPPVADQ